MSPVDFKKWQCPLSLFLKCSCRFEDSPMPPVDFKKRECLSVEFKGQVSRGGGGGGWRGACKVSPLQKGGRILVILKGEGEKSVGIGLTQGLQLLVIPKAAQ